MHSHVKETKFMNDYNYTDSDSNEQRDDMDDMDDFETLKKKFNNRSPLSQTELDLVKDSLSKSRDALIARRLSRKTAEKIHKESLEYLESVSENIVIGNVEDVRKPLNEGMLRSYPVENVEKWLRGLMDEGQAKGQVFSFEIEKDESLNGGNSLPLLRVEVTSVSTFQLASRIKSKLQFFGWYVGDLESHTLDIPERIIQTQVFIIEPVYPIENEKVDDYTRKVVASAKNGVFYHVTFSNLIPKIAVRGLVPSTQKRNMFNHPDRNYLFRTLRSAKHFAKFHTNTRQDDVYGTQEHERKINTRWIGNTRGKDTPPVKADDAYQNPTPGVSIISVNVSEMLEDSRPFKLYHDNRYEPINTAFFTTCSIPPKYLKQVVFQKTERK